MPAAEAPVRSFKSSKVFVPVEKGDRGEGGKQGDGTGRKKGGNSHRETALAADPGGQSRHRSPQEHVVITVERSIRTVETAPPEGRQRPRWPRHLPQPRRVVEIVTRGEASEVYQDRKGPPPGQRERRPAEQGRSRQEGRGPPGQRRAGRDERASGQRRPGQEERALEQRQRSVEQRERFRGPERPSAAVAAQRADGDLRTREGNLRGKGARKPGTKPYEETEPWQRALPPLQPFVERGLKKGTLFKARLRVNAQNTAEGYCSIPPLPVDVTIVGRPEDYFAVHGDEVVVSFIPRLVPPARGAWADPQVAAMTTGAQREEGGEIAEEGEIVKEAGEVSGEILASSDEIAAASSSTAAASSSTAAASSSTAAASSSTAAALNTMSIAPKEVPTKPKVCCSAMPQVDAMTPLHLPSSISVEDIAALLRAHPEHRVQGRIVGVTRASPLRGSAVGVLLRRSGRLWLQPRDPRLPPLAVEEAELSDALRRVVDEEAWQLRLAERTLVRGYLASWNGEAEAGKEPSTKASRAASRPLPVARVLGIVGLSSSLAQQADAVLCSHGIPCSDAFSPADLACLPRASSEHPWRPSAADLESRRDLRDLCVFSIDPPTARDLDDALSVEALGSDIWRVGVHIADVGHFLTPGSALDRTAAARSTSCYLPDRVVPMLPRLLCEQLCSLRQGADRLAFSLLWELDSQGRARRAWCGRSVIRSRAALAYGDAQRVIEAAERGEDAEGRWPDVRLDAELLASRARDQPAAVPERLASDASVWPEVAAGVAALHALSSALRRRRYANGCLRLDKVRLCYELDEAGAPLSWAPYVQRKAHFLVEELMLLANRSAAALVAAAFPSLAVLRRHPPPEERRMAALLERLARRGDALDARSAGALHRSLAAVRARMSAAAGAALTNAVTKPMRVAEYFCAGEGEESGREGAGGGREGPKKESSPSTVSALLAGDLEEAIASQPSYPSSFEHYALCVPVYTHFTSPIRRFPDILVHRLLAAALDLPPDASPETAAVFARGRGLPPPEELQRVCAVANERKAAAKAAQEDVESIYLATILQSRAALVEGVVLDLRGPRFFEVYVPCVDVTCRIECADVYAAEAGGENAEKKERGAEQPGQASGEGGGRSEDCAAPKDTTPRLFRQSPSHVSFSPASSTLRLGAPAGGRKALGLSADVPSIAEFLAKPDKQAAAAAASSLSPLTLPAVLSEFQRVSVVLGAVRDEQTSMRLSIVGRLWCDVAEG